MPGIVRWKGKIPPEQTSDRITGFEDWMPTLMELTGQPATTPKDSDGISFAPTLLGNKQEPRPFLYREFPGYGGQQCVLMGEWKGLRQKMQQGRQPLILYNLREDPTEMTNVAAQNPEIVKQMENILQREHLSSREFPLPSVDFDPKSQPMNKKKGKASSKGES